ncbi:hypothetical protein KFF05_12865 [bacterium SCSIO 12827]|nr:hypothetical protein KFF05_12865 [bacterium SCSIO 12827]
MAALELLRSATVHSWIGRDNKRREHAMATNPTSPEGHTDTKGRAKPKSMRDLVIFGVMIVIGIGVVAALVTK